MKTYYEILGINNDATREEITSAYRKLAFAHHPDRKEKESLELSIDMRLLNEAKVFLLDTQKRDLYDQCLLTGFDHRAAVKFTESAVGHLKKEVSAASARVVAPSWDLSNLNGLYDAIRKYKKEYEDFREAGHPITDTVFKFIEFILEETRKLKETDRTHEKLELRAIYHTYPFSGRLGKLVDAYNKLVKELAKELNAQEVNRSPISHFFKEGQEQGKSAIVTYSPPKKR